MAQGRKSTSVAMGIGLDGLDPSYALRRIPSAARVLRYQCCKHHRPGSRMYIGVAGYFRVAAAGRTACNRATASLTWPRAAADDTAVACATRLLRRLRLLAMTGRSAAREGVKVRLRWEPGVTASIHPTRYAATGRSRTCGISRLRAARIWFAVSVSTVSVLPSRVMNSTSKASPLRCT